MTPPGRVINFLVKSIEPSIYKDTSMKNVHFIVEKAAGKGQGGSEIGEGSGAEHDDQRHKEEKSRQESQV